MSPRYPADVRRIREVALRHGVTLDDDQAEAAWENYSDSMAAGWMGLPDSDDDLWSTVSAHLVEMDTMISHSDVEIRYPADVLRIRQVALRNGLALSDAEAQAAWERFSDSMAAGWLTLPEDDEDIYTTVFFHHPAL
jgi:hypothetical protein